SAIVVIITIEPIRNERFDCFWGLPQFHLNSFDMALFRDVDATGILPDRPGNEIPEFSFRIFFVEYVPADYFI
ncbi:hypothetical protein, partial [Barnesiella intestinihominis]|uniref:hypothetical protein n=1 Tax=Barnesiella intestinihominis TaxID=487174 RepID=UPI003AABEAA3